MGKEQNYSLLVKVCQEMDGKGLILSKISLQQLVYILQEVYSVKSDYQFHLFTYGPYAVSLTADLDYLFANNFLQIEYCQGPLYFGSKIKLSNNYQTILKQNKKFLIENEIKLVKVIELFGNNTARELELRGAIIYLKFNEGLKKTEIVTKIHLLKPYFKKKEIEEALDELNLKLFT